jgi:hypothetical protein
LATGLGTLLNSTNAAAAAYAPLTLDGLNTRFNVSGSEQMRLTSSGLEVKQSQLIGYSSYAGIGTNGLAVAGNVGIGTSSPAVKLDVSGTAANIGRFISSGASTSLSLDNTNANAWGSNLGIFTGGTAAGYFGTIGSLLGTTAQDLAVYATSGNGFRVYTNGNNERMRLDASGNLGIGTSSPVNKLVVSNAGAAGFEFDPANGIMQTYNRSGAAYTAAKVYGLTFEVRTGASPAANTFFIDSSGNLGIGTSPAAKLDVKKTSNDTISRTNAIGGLGDWDSLGAGLLMQQTLSSPYGFALQAANAANSVQFPLLLNPSGGNVGIGTSSPTQLFHVQKNQAAYTWARVDNQSSSASAYSGWMLGAFGNSWGMAIGSSAANSNALTWVLDAGGTNSEKMRLDSSGNLGLGVTPRAWNSDYRAFNYGSAGLLYGRVGTQEVAIGTNWLRNAGASFVYAANGFASYYAQDAGIHKWLTAPSGTAGNAISFTQAMTLDASGNLSIAATSPVFGSTNRGNITVGGSASSLLFLGTGTTTGTYISHTQSTATAEIWNTANGPMLFATNNTERARITSGGQFGIGFSGAFSALANLNILTGGQGGGVQLIRNASANPTNGQSLGTFAWKGSDSANSNAAAEAMIEAVAAENFTGSTAATNLLFYTKPTGTGPGSSPTERGRFSSDGTFRVKGAGTAGSTDAVQFSGSAPASSLLLDASGNLGVGATSLNNKLTVIGSAYFSDATTTDVQITTASSLSTIGCATNTPLAFKTNNTERARITSGGDFQITNNLTVGGNLVINGTTTTVNSTTITIDDPIFTLGGDVAPTVDDNKDRGIEFRYHNGTSAKIGFFGYDDSTGYFTFIPDATNTSEVFSGTQGDIQATNFRGNLVGNASTATTAVNVSGTVAVANGGTGATTLTANSVLLGNGTSSVQSVSPGTAGNVLTSNGTTWLSTTPVESDSLVSYFFS